MITQTTKRYNLKPGTKTVWIETASESEEVDMETIHRTVGASLFFRRLGGSEYLVRGYTCRGYLPVRLQSKNPGKTELVVRTWLYS